MNVIVSFHFMAGMVMVVSPMIPRVIMAVSVGSSTRVGMFMEMLMLVLVAVRVCMLMAVYLSLMRMLVGVHMHVVMRM